MSCDYSIENSSLVFQWHITSRCNLRCRHCYQESYDKPEMSFDELLNVVEQYKDLLESLGKKGHINVTGGEPFIRDDFFGLLEVLKANSRYFSFGILTNGSFIDAVTARRLKTLGPAFIQVSIEGDKKAHNAIRGDGNLDSVIKALKHLKKNGIKTLVSFTAHRGNYRSFPEVAELCRKYGVFKLWTDRLVPFGNAKRMGDIPLDSNEVWEFFNIVKRCSDKRKWRLGSSTIIELKRSLQFLVNSSIPYMCKAGESLITLLEDGTVLPCRRLPISAGNLKDSTLKEIYFSSKIFIDLRSEPFPPKGCEKCSFFTACRGGARCISYAVAGDYSSRDPGCPIVW